MKKMSIWTWLGAVFSDFISVPHDERISHENRTCGIFGNYLCNDFRNSYRKINSADCYDGFRKKEHLVHSIF